jgi:hypothetical protein
MIKIMQMEMLNVAVLMHPGRLLVVIAMYFKGTKVHVDL